MQNKRKIPLFFVVLALFIQMFTAIPAQAADDFSINAEAAFAIDADTGKIFYNQNGDTALEIASITKLITAYMVLDAVKQQKTSWDAQVPISEYAATNSTDPELSNVPLSQDRTYSVKELYDAAVIESGNAAAIALAEFLAGNEHTFVDQMRQLVTSWGITDATIVNASGLNNYFLGDLRYPDSGEDDENTMSARSVAIIARHLITDFPEYLDTSKVVTAQFDPESESPVEMENSNQMLPGAPLGKEGVDGLKTGTTEKAGACFAGTIERDGRRVITVVLNATDPAAGARFTETSRLMDYCLDNWQLQTIDLANHPMSGNTTLKVVDGKEDDVRLKNDGVAELWVRSDMDASQVTVETEMDETLLNNGDLIAPVRKGEKLGVTTVSLNQDDLGYLDPTEAPSANVVTSKGVEKANILLITWRKILALFN
ncbi:D-alanyl-D-alanine carboxypeptidase [Enterococcus sp. 669A]|uniref:serine-type D-Ala-D-Ala carboxypeptidase n=1 Tax=Candidatus Enterococcus moelleringii TaxID=2815325 RepID=A0ABS3L677_9ENTE|nr:serine hydrolase [Enterococcus sp. 669A]MBO1305126.1 D-alanyl-D-alanine carboxypeptidase [Enterococcus sp. 669A]